MVRFFSLPYETCLKGNAPSNPVRRRSEDGASVSETGFGTSPVQICPGSPLHYSHQTLMEPPSVPEEYSETAAFPTQPKHVPTLIVWNNGGNSVAIEGSFDNWTRRHPLQQTGRNFTVVKLLPPGVYQYKFIVDGQWKYDPNQPAMHDDAGNVNNVIEVREFVPENLGGIARFDPPPSPRESYDCDEMEENEFAKEPPAPPPHLQYTLLNVPSIGENQNALPRPWHVTLDHVYVQRGTANVDALVLGTTQRYQSKYVTTIMYKPKTIATNRRRSLQN